MINGLIEKFSDAEKITKAMTVFQTKLPTKNIAVISNNYIGLVQ